MALGLNLKSRAALAALAMLVLFGCGGAGGLGGSSNLDLSASSISIPYGSNVTINWSSRDTDTSNQGGFESANFADVRSSLPTSGSVTDSPRITTTYTMTVFKSGGGTATRSLTVSVAKGLKRFLIVGGSSSADATTAQTLLEEVTTVNPTMSPTIPVDGTGFDALILTKGGTFGPADQSKITTWLGSGKGVIIVGMAGNQLATGNIANTNTSSIASWFGGVTECLERTGGASGHEARIVPTNSHLGTCLTLRDWTTSFGRRVRWGDWAKIKTVSGAAVAQTSGSDANDPIVGSWSFQSGIGRVYFIMGLQGPAVTPDATRATLREIFLPGARWASGE